MANNENKIVDSDTNCTNQTDCFVYCNIPNATNESSSTSEKHKSFHKILKYLMRSTVRKIQSKLKKFDIKKRSVSTPCKSEEKMATTCTSLSSIVDDIIKSDVGTVAMIKQKMADAITSTTRSGEVFDKVTHENLSGVVGRCVRGASYRYAEYTARYADDAAPEHGCGPLCIGIQSDTVDGEFSLKTSPDAFAKACEERRYADFILKEIAKISDALTEKARLVSTKEQVASILASVSMTSVRYEMGEETFESTKPLISSIIYAEEEPTAVAAAAVTVMQPETLTDTQVPDSRDFSACLDESLDTASIQVIPSMKHLKKTENTRTVSLMYPEINTVTTTARKKKKEDEDSPKKIYLRPTLDKRAPVNPIIINCIPKLKKDNSKSLDVYQPNDIQTGASRRRATTVKNGIIDFSIKTSQVEEPAQVAKDILQESVPLRHKKPKYRDKYRINDSYMTKERKVPQFEEIRIPKDSDNLPKYGCLSFSPPQTIRSSMSFNSFERPTMKMYQDCRSKPLKCLQPTRHCEDLIPHNIYLERPKCCDVWISPCFGSQNEATRNATLSPTHCRPLQDSYATEYRAGCHSKPLDSHASSRYCNINDCPKHRVTFENSLCTKTYFKNDAKYCYPHLNNIDNVRMGYYHCNDSCPVRNSNQHCGRDRSYYWTKGNLYFTHPWTSEHLLRHN
ncbi:Signal transducer and activator of transcription 2 [Temnothorax longispinosus]|uniref:Signal transducer and activator of transcription 2 n=1 Tax=Temnothorax longispinosus TaxID=300112 RepID=A0A4S2L0N4_9HYME|nr:Signal transducer and activator of transcription 2 [Temnothorax longispinosus]